MAIITRARFALTAPRANFRPMLQGTRPWRPGLAQLEQHSTCTCHMPRAQRQLMEGGTEHRRMRDICGTRSNTQPLS
eukprot:scaffold5981_cov141-Isochrysis_galbana.AAC.6